MPYFNDSFIAVRKKFWQHHVHFKNFSNINTNRLTEIKNDVTKYTETHQREIINARDQYIQLLNYLIVKREYTYDEKLIFIIYVLDPELNVLNIFNNTVKLNKTEIDKLPLSNQKEEILEEYKRQYSNFELGVRNQIGFFESNLHKIERLFQIYLIEKNSLTINVKTNALIGFVNSLKEIDFQDNFLLSDDEYEKVRTLCLEYHNNYPNYDVKDMFYHVIKQGSLINLNNISEKIVFIIELIDPTLSCFIAYKEEASWKRIANRVDHELVPYIKEIVELEKIYYKLYQPNINYLSYN